MPTANGLSALFGGMGSGIDIGLKFQENKRDKQRMKMAERQDQREAELQPSRKTKSEADAARAQNERIMSDIDRQVAEASMRALPPDARAQIFAQIQKASAEEAAGRAMKAVSDGNHAEAQNILAEAQTRAQIISAQASAAAAGMSARRNEQGMRLDLEQHNADMGGRGLKGAETAIQGMSTSGLFRPEDQPRAMQAFRDKVSGKPISPAADQLLNDIMTQAGTISESTPTGAAALGEQKARAGFEQGRLEEFNATKGDERRRQEGLATQAEYQGKGMKRAYDSEASTEAQINKMIKEYADLATSGVAANDPLIAARMVDLRKKLEPQLVEMGVPSTSAPTDNTPFQPSVISPEPNFWSFPKAATRGLLNVAPGGFMLDQNRQAGIRTGLESLFSGKLPGAKRDVSPRPQQPRVNPPMPQPMPVQQQQPPTPQSTQPLPGSQFIAPPFGQQFGGQPSQPTVEEIVAWLKLKQGGLP